MKQYDSQHDLLKIYQRSFKNNFSLPALTDYETDETLSYGEFARRIARIHLFFKQIGVEEGDKVALYGRNSISWITAFMATVTYGAIVVPILSDFNPHDVQHIVNHSDSVIMFGSEKLMESLDFTAMPRLKAMMSLERRRVVEERSFDDDSILSTSDVAKTLRNLTRRFRTVYPKSFTAADIKYPTINPQRIALINYTSGTTGFSKGVMLSLENLAGNVIFGIESKLHYSGSRSLAFLPLAHAYGCAFDMLVPLAVGTHVTVLGRIPSPRVLMAALAKVRPSLIICVPLIFEKIYKKIIVPKITKRAIRWSLAVPFLDKAIYAKIRQQLIQTFGGEFEEVIIGGAALNQEVENFLHTIKFPFTVGYGMTECAPLISYTHWREFIPGSSGQVLPGIMEAKIDSTDPYNVPGEILVKGMNVMRGYYKKPDATEQTIEPDGWLHTGDMGILGGENRDTIFICGRCKTMILSGNGQNIYPEGIESKLNNMPFVAESLVVERDGHLVALVFPDSEATDAHAVTDEELPAIMEQTRLELNGMLAAYERIDKIQLVPGEFEKTPKRSIKRYLYL
jgi:long-chain acyl-CoA synthetase